MKLLTSKDNPQVKALAALLRQKKQRDYSGLFVAEGAKLCDDIIKANLRIVKAFVSPKAKEKYPVQAKKLFEVSKESWEISDELAHWAADTKSPQGLFVICERPSNPIVLKENGKYIILDNLQDPGNIGTILRTALALGIDGAFVSEDSAELYSPKLLRSSMGAVIRLPISVSNDIGELIDILKSEGVKIYATALGENSKVIDQKLFDETVAVVLGNEGNGLSNERINSCNESIVIPMNENAESLNVGVAAGILMWEMTKGKV